MAATTTAPQLWSVGVTKDQDDPLDLSVVLTFRARSLTTGELIEHHATFKKADFEPLDQAWWDDAYDGFYASFSARTGDTTHATNPIDILAGSADANP